MATTTKREIAERVAQQSGLAQVEVKQVIQMLFDEIVKEVCSGNRLEFRDFGVFEVVVRKPRTGRNPRTGQKVSVPPKTVVTFKMGKVMKEKVARAAGGAAPSSGSTAEPRPQAAAPAPQPPAQAT